MTLPSTATKTAMLLFISCWVVQNSSGMAFDRNGQQNGFISVLKNKAMDLWHSMQGGLVSFMSVQEPEGEALADLPNLPTLAGQLGLNSLVADVVKAGLTDALSVKGPRTLLGPTDVAFATVPDWLKTALENGTILTQVLRFHVLKDKLLFADITDELTAKTLQGIAVRFNIYPNNVVTAQCAQLDEVSVDKMASNGVLHELKQVMKPPPGNMVQVVSACPVFKTLVTAVETAGLTTVLSGEGPFTLFAPTDSAFKKLDPQTLNVLMKNKTALTDVVEYHVSRKTYCSVGLVSLSSLQMLNGEEVNVTTDAEAVKVNDAVILPPGVDGSVSNGVVHAIDTVLIPPSLRLHLSPLSSEQSDPLQ
ncbi:transforming growth factor-beta-induced protein ig-h3-like [Babylonia areolata]|uniref:transforming growth factor-beta-induced protein ig-h3-like n=1 Tax=Babylonia areolata TaxID=304850 RepID=UPI003FD47DF8